MDQRGLAATGRRLEAMAGLVEDLPVYGSVHLHAPFTMAAQLLGAQELYVLCLEDPARAHQLLRFCVHFSREFERTRARYGISPEPLDELSAGAPASAGCAGCG